MVSRVHLDVVAKTKTLILYWPFFSLQPASHITDRAIPAPCGQRQDILIRSGEEHLNFYQPCIWNRHEQFHATFHFNIVVINLKCK
jgi:hypothetical protein